MYVMVDRRGSLGVVICKVRFLPIRRGKCELGTGAKLTLGASSGEIPVCSRNEWRRGLHGGQAGSLGSHA